MKKIFALLCMATGFASAQPSNLPSEGALIQAQGVYARAQLESLASLFKKLPPAAAKEAFASGNAAIDWRHYSPSLGGIARGPTLGESIAPLLANVEAVKLGCPTTEGPCQVKAWNWAKDQARTILASSHPGIALANIMGDMK